MKTSDLVNSVLDKLKKGEWERGSTARYIQIRRGLGVKLYRYKEDRDNCYKFQKILFLMNLAPKASKKFEVDENRENESKEWFCYVTQHAKKATIDDFYNLNDTLRNLNISWWDGASGNSGLINGRPVVIDCEQRFFDKLKA